ncbi:hypothetical protein Rcae01_00165 [Novipirellula caenicola]|uniref:Uncharacterized protein n=1 Tax=Novipirellula caenicola TaxID=1536901 RepID=A0ABP9VJ79_9BACT
MDFLVRQWWIRRTRKSIVRLKQQAARDFRYGFQPEPRGCHLLCWRHGAGPVPVAASKTVDIYRAGRPASIRYKTTR